jgi:hypothetical protein
MSILIKYSSDWTIVDPNNLSHSVTISSVGKGVQDMWLYLRGSLFEDEIGCICYDQVVTRGQHTKRRRVYISVVSKIRIVPWENVEDLCNCGFRILCGIWENSNMG